MEIGYYQSVLPMGNGLLGWSYVADPSQVGGIQPAASVQEVTVSIGGTNAAGNAMIQGNLLEQVSGK